MYLRAVFFGIQAAVKVMIPAAPDACEHRFDFGVYGLQHSDGSL